MNRKEMVYSCKGSTNRSEARINAELDFLFGEGCDEFSTEDFQEYMRTMVFHSNRHRYSSNWARNHSSTVLGVRADGSKIVKPGAPVI